MITLTDLSNCAHVLRATKRVKDGKEHRYWSIVENRRCGGNRVVQRQVLYLGEINDQQHAAWCKTIEVAQADKRRPQQVAIFPEDRQAPELDCDVIQVKLSELQLKRPRQWGACWLACELWDHLLQSGVEINVIRAWLGHVSLKTTNRYAEIDIQMKAQALEACEPPTATSPRKPMWRDDRALLEWLQSL